jgi:hypothetical protein
MVIANVRANVLGRVACSNKITHGMSESLTGSPTNFPSIHASPLADRSAH